MSEETKPWQRADVDVSDALVRDLLQAQAPGVGEATYLHEGWDSRAFLVGGEWIFRFPKRAESAQRLLCEIALLPQLSPRLSPVAIPRFEHIGQPSPAYPYCFVGYRRLPGELVFQREDDAPIDSAQRSGAPFFDSAQRSEAPFFDSAQRSGAPFFDSAQRSGAPCIDTLAIAAQLGRACAALHAFPTEVAAAAGVRRRGWYADLAELAATAIQRLRAVAAAAPVEAARLEALLADVPAPYSGAAVLCHADLAPEHLLTDAAGARLLGLIDFGDLMLGDPAVDLAGAVLLGGDAALAAALTAYPHPVDAGLRARARLLAACRIADDLMYGIQDHRPLYLRAASRSLRQL